MFFQYCAKCGQKLESIKSGDDDCMICPSCKQMYGSSPFPVVEVLVVNEYKEILLLKQDFGSSEEVDDLRWYKIDEVDDIIASENNCSKMHFEKCKPYLM